MFKLIALIFLITNGVVSEDPVSQLRNARSFDTRQECEAYIATPAGIVSKMTLNSMIAADVEHAYKSAFVCEPEPARDKI